MPALLAGDVLASPVDVVTAKTAVPNVASQRVLAKNGFTQTAGQRDPLGEPADRSERRDERHLVHHLGAVRCRLKGVHVPEAVERSTDLLIGEGVRRVEPGDPAGHRPPHTTQKDPLLLPSQ